ncbi:MAG: COX15/CtaA family protein [Ekhidna sp.]
MVGVLIGFLVFLNMIFAFAFRSRSKWIPFMGVMIFVLTGFQGWVGSLVVSTNLLHGFITFHMLLALVIVAMLIWMNVRVRELSIYPDKNLFIVSLLTTLLFIPQLILGTEVRGVIDDLLISTIGRSEWSQSLSDSFYIHRSYSWLILIGAVAIFYYARKTEQVWVINLSMRLVFLVFLAMIAGIGMVRFDFPVWLQPLHLILAVGIFSYLFYLTLRLKFVK